MSDLALAVLLALVSAVAYAGGAIVQERVAAAAPGPQYVPLRRPVWWASVGLNGLGAALHVAALALGPLSLVQPLGALTIVFALPLAALCVGRRGSGAAWRGALLATVGLAGLLSLTGDTDGASLSGQQRLMVALITLGGLAALVTAARTVRRHTVLRSVLLAMASGAAFGIASVFTKTAALDWSGHAPLSLLVPSLAVIAGTALTGLFLSQASYRGAGLAAPLSTLTVVNPVVAAAIGLTLFDEGFHYGTTGAVLALGCGIVAASGLVLLTMERIDANRAQPPAATAVTAAKGLPMAMSTQDPAQPAQPTELARPIQPTQGAERRLVTQGARASMDAVRPQRTAALEGLRGPERLEALEGFEGLGLARDLELAQLPEDRAQLPDGLHVGGDLGLGSGDKGQPRGARRAAAGAGPGAGPPSGSPLADRSGGTDVPGGGDLPGIEDLPCAEGGSEINGVREGTAAPGLRDASPGTGPAELIEVSDLPGLPHQPGSTQRIIHQRPPRTPCVGVSPARTRLRAWGRLRS